MHAEIEFDCIHCGQKLVVSPEDSGQKILCPQCEGGMIVPRYETEAAASSSGEQLPSDDLKLSLERLEQERDALKVELEQVRRETHAIFDKQREATRLDRERAATAVETLELRLADRETELAQTRTFRPHLEASRAEAEALRLTLKALKAASRASEEGRARLKVELQQVGEDADEILLRMQKTAEQEKNSAARSIEALAVAAEELKSELVEARKMVPQMEALREQNASLRREVDVVRGAYATADADRSHFEADAAQLRADLTSSKDGREFAALREQYTAAQVATRVATAAKELAEGELTRLNEHHRKQKGDIEGLLVRLKAAEDKAEALIDASLQRDNDLLRGIVERQKGELQRSYDESSRFRQTRFAARIVYLVLALAIIAVLALAVKWAPAAIEAAKW